MGRFSSRRAPAGRSLGCRGSTPLSPPRFPAPDRPCPHTIIALPGTHPCRAGRSALLGYMLPGLAGAWPALRAPLGVEDRTASGRGYALTFDDGPHAQGTPAVLEMLSREHVTATFFLVGEQVRRNPTLAREIRDAGHAIALHCDRHRNLLRLAPWQVREDIARRCRQSRTLPGLAHSSTARPTASSTPPLCVSRVPMAGARCCGATGAGTGTRRPRRPRSQRGSQTVRATARCCCCTMPTTTPRPAHGAGRCRAATCARDPRRARARRRAGFTRRAETAG